MKVHLIKEQSIKAFISENARAKPAFNNWLAVVRWANWNSPADIVTTFNSADLLGNGTERVVFNVGGNNYRLICKYNFGAKYTHLFIKWIGDHKAYTRLCEKGEQYTVDNF